MALGLFAACSEKVDPKAILGTWKVESVEGDSDTVETFNKLIEMGAEILFTFEEDGTYEMKVTFMGQEEIQPGAYTLKNDRLALGDELGTTKVTVIDETHLKFKGDEAALTLAKQ